MKAGYFVFEKMQDSLSADSYKFPINLRQWLPVLSPHLLITVICVP